MNLHDALKKIERLEHDTRVLRNHLDGQQRILDEFVALLTIHSRADIDEIKIISYPQEIPPKTKIYLKTGGVDGTISLDSRAIFKDVIDQLNNITPCRFSIDKRYLDLPIGKLPDVDRKNLYTNNCLIIIKL